MCGPVMVTLTGRLVSAETVSNSSTRPRSTVSVMQRNHRKPSTWGWSRSSKMVSALTRRPVKVTMTGPLMLTKVAYDEHYDDSGR